MQRLSEISPGQLDATVVWDKQVTGGFTSSEGSGGVCFLTTDVGAYVIKGSMLVVQELFSSLLLQALHVPTAAMRVTDSNEHEWSNIKSAVRRAILIEKGEGNGSIAQRLGSMMSGPLLRAQLLILELVKGNPLEGNVGAKTLLSVAASQSADEVKKTQQRLQDLGEIMMVDVYLNNFDRVPLPCWSNDGNAGNVMVADGHVVAIDSIVNTVDLSNSIVQERHALYLEKAEKLFTEIIEAKDGPSMEASQGFKAVQTFVLNSTGYSITADDYAEVRVGMLQGMVKIEQLTRTTIVQDLHANLSKMFTNSWEQGWAKGCESIKLEYFKSVEDIFIKAAKMINKDEVGDIQPPTLVLPIRSVLRPSHGRDKPYARQPKAVKVMKPVGAKKTYPVAGFGGKGMKRPPMALNSNMLQAGIKGLAKREAPVVQKVLTVSKKPESDKLGAEALMTEAKVDEFVKFKCGEGVPSKLLKLDREGTHEEILRFAVAHKVDLVAFDFDQTLTEPKKNKNDKTAGPRMRGGKSSLKALQDLHRNGVDMIIITATKPGRDAATSVAAEVCELGLGPEFHASNRYDLEALKGEFSSAGAVGTLSNEQLTERLIVLMLVHTRLRGIDLWRASSKGLKLAASGRIESFCTRTMQSESKVDDFESLGQLSTPYKVPNSPEDTLDLSTCLQEYLKRIEKFQAEQLFRELGKNGDFNEQAMTLDSLLLRLDQFSTRLKFPDHVKRSLAHGFAEDIKTKNGVVIAKAGKVFCSGYNKAEALEWYIQSRATKPKSVAFVDDNTDNVFNLFMSFKSSPLVEKIYSIWFEPPTFGQMETGSSFANSVVKKAAMTNSVMEYHRGLSEKRSLVLTDETSTSVGVLVLQASPTTIQYGAKHVRKKLSELEDAEQVNFVVLPEGYIRQAVLDGDEYGELQPYCDVAKDFKIYLVCGTMVEKKSNRQYYITSVLIGPDGVPRGKYRKRKVHDFETQAQGDSVGVYDTEYGKVGIVICLDAEDDKVIQETLAAGAEIIFNPTHIPSTRGTSGNGKVWTFALQSMQRRFEKICSDKGCYVVRCDTSYPSGLGSSQVIGPRFTQTVPSSSDETMLVRVLGKGKEQERINSMLSGVPNASYIRTENEDNIGPRIKVTQIRTSQLKSKPYIKFVHNKPTGDLAMYSADKKLSCKLLNLATLREEDPGPWIDEWVDVQKQAPINDSTQGIAMLDRKGEYAVSTSGSTIDLLRLSQNKPELMYSFSSPLEFNAVAVNVINGAIAAASSEGVIALIHFSHNNVACRFNELLA